MSVGNEVGTHFPLTTREGWDAFATAALRPTPTLLPEQDFQRLDSTERAVYNEARLDHHARLVTVTTPTMRSIVTTGKQLLVINRHQISARRGLIVTGAPGTGKTTAITQFGKAHHYSVRRRLPNGAGRMPVVYVTVPPAATPKILAVEFARFLGLPVNTRHSQVEITNAVCSVLCELGCDLVIVDEIHNLNLATRSGAEASDQLKYLSERIPATFIYAGIDVEYAGLFAGPRGRQIAGRFVTQLTEPFRHSTPQHRRDWQALVARLEHSLCLHHHRDGTLLGQAAYLHDRSAGMIGSLTHLIRAAASQAIHDGSERITKSLLEGIPVDTAAQAATPPRRRSPKRVSNRKAAG